MKRFFRLIFGICSLFLLLQAASIVVTSSSEAANPLKKLTDIQKQIKQKMRKAGAIKKKEENIEQSITGIEKDISRREKDLQRYNREISQAKAKIRELTAEIESRRGKLEGRIARLRDYVRTMYKQRVGGSAMFLVSASDYQDLVRRSRYVNMLAYNESRVIDNFSGDILVLKNRNDELKSLEAGMRAKKQYLDRKKEELLSARKKKDILLARVRRSRSYQEQEIRELSDASRQLQNMIRSMAGKKIPASIIGKGFSALKGHIPWPASGRIVTDAQGNSNGGILINIVPGEKAKAVAGGRVVYRGSFSGYGKLLIVDHGNGFHTLYGNLRDFSIQEGDLLIEGMDIGAVDKMNKTGAETLYFEIRYKGKPVNPSGWLKKRPSFTG